MSYSSALTTTFQSTMHKVVLYDYNKAGNANDWRYCSQGSIPDGTLAPWSQQTCPTAPSSTYRGKRSYCRLNVKCPLRLMYLNALSPARGLFGEVEKSLKGGVSPEEVGHRGWSLRFDCQVPFPVWFLFLSCGGNVISWCCVIL